MAEPTIATSAVQAEAGHAAADGLVEQETADDYANDSENEINQGAFSGRRQSLPAAAQWGPAISDGTRRGR
jgi:hypothetical protein